MQDSQLSSLARDNPSGLGHRFLTEAAQHKRALDAGESAAIPSTFLASSFLCSQAESTPAPAPVTQTVMWT